MAKSICPQSESEASKGGFLFIPVVTVVVLCGRGWLLTFFRHLPNSRSHFSEMIGYYEFLWCFITKVWSVYHVKFINAMECFVGSLQKCAKFTCKSNTFRRLLVTMDFYDVSLEKYDQFFMWPLSSSSKECFVGGLQKFKKKFRQS